MSWTSSAGQFLAGVTVATLDSILVVAFSSNAKLSLIGREVNKEFHIVTVYGIISCIMICTCDIIYAIVQITPDPMLHETQFSVLAALLVVINMVQFAMKVSLHQYKISERSKANAVAGTLSLNEQLARESIVKGTALERDGHFTRLASELKPIT
ncbi:hypothetical protein HDU82_005610 [Entophlyctis luteolus]|nr:hypothetical protein HDU82_005610 [Entophlyctis luteolus]